MCSERSSNSSVQMPLFALDVLEPGPTSRTQAVSRLFDGSENCTAMYRLVRGLGGALPPYHLERDERDFLGILLPPKTQMPSPRSSPAPARPC